MAELLSLSLVCKDFKQRLDMLSQPVPFPRFSDPLTRSGKFSGKLKTKKYKVLLSGVLFIPTYHLFIFVFTCIAEGEKN